MTLLGNSEPTASEHGTKPHTVPAESNPAARWMSASFALSHAGDQEVHVAITSGPLVQRQWLIEISRFRLSLAYMPHDAVITDFENGTMLKVVSGQIQMQQQPNTKPVLVSNCTYPFGLRDMTLRADDNVVTATEETILLVILPLFDASKEDFPVLTDSDAVNTTIRHPAVAGLADMRFVEYAGMGFWNLTGFTLALDGRRVAHEQFWLAGKGVHCGVHDHADVVGDAAFCEIHACVVNGTGHGGMLRSKLPLGTAVDTFSRDDMSRLPVPSGHEHGPFWEWAADGTPARRADGSVVYRPHAWVAGTGDAQATDLSSMDFWVATEIWPGYVPNSL